MNIKNLLSWIFTVTLSGFVVIDLIITLVVGALFYNLVWKKPVFAVRSPQQTVVSVEEPESPETKEAGQSTKREIA